jgi:hypothetical protein
MASQIKKAKKKKHTHTQKTKKSALMSEKGTHTTGIIIMKSLWNHRFCCKTKPDLGVHARAPQEV